jgi:curved DNA-binding protein CbpA
MAESTTRTPTHYDILGVRPTASPQQIRRAFRDLSKLYHPDTTELPPAEATEKFQQLNEAYAVLSSPDRRWSYDKQVGYSRISVMQPLEPLSRSQVTPRRKEMSNVYLDPNDRPLSAGEIFALFILGLTFVACLVLVLTIGFTQGETALNSSPLPPAETVEIPFSGKSTQIDENPSAPETFIESDVKRHGGTGKPGKLAPSPDVSQDLRAQSPTNSQADKSPPPPSSSTIAPSPQPTWL